MTISCPDCAISCRTLRPGDGQGSRIGADALDSARLQKGLAISNKQAVPEERLKIGRRFLSIGFGPKGKFRKSEFGLNTPFHFNC